MENPDIAAMRKSLEALKNGSEGIAKLFPLLALPLQNVVNALEDLIAYAARHQTSCGPTPERTDLSGSGSEYD